MTVPAPVQEIVERLDEIAERYNSKLAAQIADALQAQAAEIEQLRAGLEAALASPCAAEAEPVVSGSRYCQCVNSKTNPCIVCGKRKFIDPEWLRSKIESDPDESEVGAGFELCATPPSPDMDVEVRALRDFASWIDTWVSNPIGAYSVMALDGLFSQARSKLAAIYALQPAAAPGWKLVPVEPTPEMLAAFWRQKTTGCQEPGKCGFDRSDYAAYYAMLAAAPLPAAPGDA